MQINGPYRLAARTPGSHPGNRGSIPRKVTRYTKLATSPILKTKTPLKCGVFM